MYFFIDGYNFLFWLSQQKGSLKEQRRDLIIWLKDVFTYQHLKGIVIFDGSHRSNEESGLAYSSPLDIAYAPKELNADAYIQEKLITCKQRHLCVVVTDDRSLRKQIRDLGAQVESNAAFLKKSFKKEKNF